MSIDASRWAWTQKVKPTQKLILLSLADRADEYFNCYPSITRLTIDTGLDRKTVIKGLQSMESDGFLEIIRTEGEVNYYRLIGVVDRHVTSTKNGMGRPVPKTGLHPYQKRDDHPSQKRDTNLSIEPIKNQEKEITNVISKKTGETIQGKRLDFESLPDAWRSFCADERPELPPDGVFARFRDYWIAQPGAKGRKLDWFATWRNWVRNEKAVNGNGTNRQSGQHRKLSAVELVQQASQRYDDAERQRHRQEKIIGSSH